MNGSPKQETLELQVADFGPIVEAKIDLRPLTVFVGPSNTGKSYLAILIYALHRVFRRRGFRFPLVSRRQDLTEETVNALWEVANALPSDSRLSGHGTIVLPAPAAEALRTELNDLADALPSEISRCFGVGELHELIRKETASRARVVMRRRLSDQADVLEHTISLAPKSEVRIMVPAEAAIPVDFDNRMRGFGRLPRLYLDEREKEELPWIAALELLSHVCRVMLPSLVGPLHLPAYYLPADRTGVMHAHSVVVSALIASAPTAGLRPAARTPMLSGVLADFLEQLIEIGQTGRGRQGAKRDLGGDIEKLILDGSVRIDRSTDIGYPRFVYRPHGWKDDLALANASSMVSELAPVVLYLRHMIGPGSVLIVEEPESHLHPAMQVNLTRQLAELIKAGIRVIVTTHSEWLLEELANIVRRSQLPEASRKDGDVALRPDQVGAWLFQLKQRPKGSVVSEIGLDDSGLYPTGFDDVAAELHNDWADITSRIEASS